MVQFYYRLDVKKSGSKKSNDIFNNCSDFLLLAALLSGTLRTIQRAACDGETLTLRCPLGTAVSIQLAQYGRPAPGINLCPAVQQQPTDDTPLVVAHSNDTCALTPQMQVGSILFNVCLWLLRPYFYIAAINRNDEP